MRYSVQIDRAVRSLVALNKDGMRKAGSTYRIVREGDTIRLYHYGACLGGVRQGEAGPVRILGRIVSRGDCIALNTIYRAFGIPQRVHRRQTGEVYIDRA